MFHFLERISKAYGTKSGLGLDRLAERGARDSAKYRYAGATIRRVGRRSRFVMDNAQWAPLVFLDKISEPRLAPSPCR